MTPKRVATHKLRIAALTTEQGSLFPFLPRKMYLQLFHCLYSLLLPPKDSVLPEEINPSPNSEICLGQMPCKQWTGLITSTIFGTLNQSPHTVLVWQGQRLYSMSAYKKKVCMRRGRERREPTSETAQSQLLASRCCARGREATAHSQCVVPWTCREIRVRGRRQPRWEREGEG